MYFFFSIVFYQSTNRVQVDFIHCFCVGKSKSLWSVETCLRRNFIFCVPHPQFEFVSEHFQQKILSNSNLSAKYKNWMGILLYNMALEIKYDLECRSKENVPLSTKLWSHEKKLFHKNNYFLIASSFPDKIIVLWNLLIQKLDFRLLFNTLQDTFNGSSISCVHRRTQRYYKICGEALLH